MCCPLAPKAILPVLIILAFAVGTAPPDTIAEIAALVLFALNLISSALLKFNVTFSPTSTKPLVALSANAIVPVLVNVAFLAPFSILTALPKFLMTPELLKDTASVAVSP